MRVSGVGNFLNIVRANAAVRSEFRDTSKTLMESSFSQNLQIRFQARANRKILSRKIGKTRKKYRGVSVLPRANFFSTEAPAEALCAGARGQKRANRAPSDSHSA
jgi:hypothetical protein